MAAINRLHFDVVQQISEASTRLRMSTIAFGTACTLYHRFFGVFNTKELDPHTVAMTAISLACKVEDEHKRVCDIINVCFSVTHKDEPLLDIGEESNKLRESLRDMELFLMRTLAFKVRVDEHPHKYIVYYLDSLNKWFGPKLMQNSRLISIAWALLRDAYFHPNLVLDYLPQHLAVSIIHLALQLCAMEMPGDHYSRVPWWKALSDDLKRDTIDEIQLQLMNVYVMDDRVEAEEIPVARDALQDT